ncbi:MAG: EAL domain-containing protein [Clostridiales Family XIII bacterium]|nr:EAL domain-containing protein [Anaerovorax odorimutans]MCI7303142.1 EAL domain-containing protein [Clostridia bacterium]MDY3011978.1 EAL domain-containing protein [Clostridiales Family XIII bacterium]
MVTKTFSKIRNTESPLVKRLIIPMGVLVILEILLLVGSIFAGGLTSSLDQNAKDILQQKVASRATYLQNEMVESWSNVGLTVESVNAKAQALDKKGAIDLSKIDDSSEQSAPLLDAVADDLISMMRTNHVTGAFIILNTEDLSKASSGKKPGLYFRDLDPVSATSINNGDLLLKCAPISLVNKLAIPTDSDWKPQFDFTETSYHHAAFFYKPYQNALVSDSDISVSDLGYWSLPFVPSSDMDGHSVISYSVPLRLSDGTVYGVLGADITLDYLQKQLPYDELTADKQGAYLLALRKGTSFQFTDLFVNGPVYSQATQDISDPDIRKADDSNLSYFLDTGKQGGTFYCAINPLNLYNTNTAFSNDQWVLIGSVKTSDLFSASHNVKFILTVAIIITLLLGIGGSILISYLIARPITSLSHEMDVIDPQKPISLMRTNIREIDQLSTSIEQLSRDMIDSSNKFTQILTMASVRLAGFDINVTSNTIYITSHFFDLFNMPNIDTEGLSILEFQNCMKQCEPYINKDSGNQVFLYEIPTNSGTSYIQLKYINAGNHHIGLAEDITHSILERRLIEHERDHDLLTGLINRRAFHREMNRLFTRDSHLLKTAAMVMMDLDNLKYTNDTYGHDCGDKYIKSAAECFVSAVPSGTIISRISGDEFYLFFYGYSHKKEIYQAFDTMKKTIDSSQFMLPDGQITKIRVTGGIAWYPKDSTSYEELIRYADFAMYKTKRASKGHFSDFDIGDYNEAAYMMQSKTELNEILTKGLIEYHFQPIVSTTTGEIFAYEALMRANMPTLRSPNEILSVAKEEGKLSQIESLTVYKSFEAFAGHMRSGSIGSNCKLFFNSLPNQGLSPADIKQVETLYADYLPLVVFEITEEEHLSKKLQTEKSKFIQKWGCGLALDDYGSGYNSEKALLDLSPDYIKVDMNIIRSIDQDTNKQEIVHHIVSYGHERNMKIIAEGIESPEEADTVIRLGVDYLQGYYLAKPALLPPKPDPSVLKLITSISPHRP